MFKVLPILRTTLLISACATQAISNQDIDAMGCAEIIDEIEQLSVTAKNTAQNSEMSRVADTGSTVVATGAGLAGVPYVGGVISIGRVLFNHSKQSTAIKADHAQQRLHTLNEIAATKNCYAAF